MDNITALLHKFSMKSIDVVTIASQNSSNVPNAQAMFENGMTVAELLDSEWSPDIEVSTIITLQTKITFPFINILPLFNMCTDVYMF